MYKRQVLKSTLPVPLGVIVRVPLLFVVVIVLPSTLTLSTCKAVKVPKLVILVCAAVLSVPTKAVDVILVAPVTTPASTLIVPSKRIAEPLAGSILIAAPESKVKTPAESISTVPSAVI